MVRMFGRTIEILNMFEISIRIGKVGMFGILELLGC